MSTDYGELKYYIRNDNFEKEKFILQSKGPVYLYTFISNGKRKQKFFNENSIRSRVVLITANLFNLGWNISDFQPEVRDCYEQFLNYVQKEINDPKSIDSSIMRIYILIISFASNMIPKNIIEYINAKINIGNASPFVCRIFGRLLHNCDELWQQKLLKRFLSILDKSYENNKSKPEKDVWLDVSVESVLIVFARAIWHDERFVLRFTYDNIIKILFNIKIAFNKNLIKLNKLVKLIKTCDSDDIKQKKYNRDICMALDKSTAYLELVLGLMRTRLSSDDNIKLLMIPDSEFNKYFLRLLNNFDRFIIKNNFNPRCFLEIDLDSSKFKTNNQPIIDAVRYYLTSEDDSEAICIVGIASEHNNTYGEID